MVLLRDIYTHTPLILILILAFFLRCAIALFPYSGMGDAPTFGDYEAQRHWMEITLHLPLSQWYTFSPDYWPLDYPPLSAWHALGLGGVGKTWIPAGFALDSSRGFESPQHKWFMRMSVLVSDIVVYFPAVLVYSRVAAVISPQSNKVKSTRLACLFTLLCLVPLILIDHGHFQYNAVSLGFALFAFTFLIRDYHVLAAVLFSFALLFKQMSLYYALPVFFFLLGKCVYHPTRQGVALFVKLAITVLLTFTLVLAPFFFVGGFSSLIHIFQRVFPVKRGLFEDKVANLWCLLDILVKLRRFTSPSLLFRLSALSTLLFSLPPSLPFLFSSYSSRKLQQALPYSLAGGSLAFFLFSFQVHEKSILLPCLPIAMLYPYDPIFAAWFLSFAAWSMIPLLVRDGCLIPSLCLIPFYLVSLRIFDSIDASTPCQDEQKHSDGVNKGMMLIQRISSVLAGLIQLLDLTITPPETKPHLWIVANTLLSTGVFTVSYLYLVYRLYRILGLTGHSSKNAEHYSTVLSDVDHEKIANAVSSSLKMKRGQRRPHSKKQE